MLERVGDKDFEQGFEVVYRPEGGEFFDRFARILADQVIWMAQQEELKKRTKYEKDVKEEQ